MGIEHELDMLFTNESGVPFGSSFDENASRQKLIETFFSIANRYTIKSHVNASGNNAHAQLCETLLRDGGRMYCDMSTVEIASTECLGPKEVVLHDKAADILVNTVLGDWRSRASLPPLHPHKKNTSIITDPDHVTPRSRGFHENYLVKRGLYDTLIRETVECASQPPMSERAKFWILFLLVRYLITGSGGIVSVPKGRSTEFVFAASPRFFAMERFVGCHTTNNVSRGLLDSRKEHLMGNLAFGGRLHVISGDANMMEKALWLTVGMSSLVLELLEEEAWDETLTSNFEYSPETGSVGVFLREVSLDLRGRTKILLQNGRQERIIDILWRYLGLCEKQVARRTLR